MEKTKSISANSFFKTEASSSTGKQVLTQDIDANLLPNVQENDSQDCVFLEQSFQAQLFVLVDFHASEVNPREHKEHQ